MALAGQVSVNQPIRIVEGVYALHPRFGDYADLTVFCDVDATEQMRRINKRNGKVMAKRFEQEWIPMEERYFTHTQIQKRVDIII